jgi:hypothetical protein
LSDIIIRKKRAGDASTHTFLVRPGHSTVSKGTTVTWRNNIPASEATGVRVDLTFDPNAANIFDPGPDIIDIPANDGSGNNSASRQVRADAAGGSGGQYKVFVRTSSGAIQPSRRGHGDSEPEVEVKT